MRDPIDDVADRHLAEIEKLPATRGALLQTFMAFATGAFAEMHPDDVKTAIRMLRECDECPNTPQPNRDN